MLNVDLRKFAAQVAYFEGSRLAPYRDSKGIWTIGIGHNLEKRQTARVRGLLGLPAAAGDVPAIVTWLQAHPLTEAQQQALFEEDARAALDALGAYPWVETLCEVRQRVLADLMFNMGPGTFASFAPTWEYARRGEWDAVAERMGRWKWARDVGPRRATPLIAMMRTGADVVLT